MKDPKETYRQPTKAIARQNAISHAVDLMTTRRTHAAVVSADHVERIRSHLLQRGWIGDDEAALACDQLDIDSWRGFRNQVIGAKEPTEITVAYLAGPEPSNDLEVFLKCGIRPENIWAFEIEKGAFESGLGDIKKSGLRGVKLVPVSIEDYFTGTPRRFDVIYIDACGPLPSQDQKTARLLVNLFRHSALAPLGVLITNFAKPDVSSDQKIEPYAQLVASYLYPKSFRDAPAGGITDDAWADGFVLRNDAERKESFYHEVCENFDHYYGSFITRHLYDIAALIAPFIRLSNSRLLGVVLKGDFNAAVERGKRLVRFAPHVFEGADEEGEEGLTESDTGKTNDSALNDEAMVAAISTIVSNEPFESEGLELGEVDDRDTDGDAIVDSSLFSLLWTLAACGCYETDSNFDAPPVTIKKFLEGWVTQIYGTPTDKKAASDIVAAYYAWRHDPALRSDAMQKIANYPYRERMPILCDVPTEEIGLYPAFAQLAYPAHCNVRETKRYCYIAEGKTTTMFLDVLPFDECRYVYDWLSALHLVPDDWNDISAQLTFRFALDAIAKEGRWYGDDFLFGCHAIGECEEFPMSELGPRAKINKQRVRKKTPQKRVRK
jgi:hypothetical protein